jgi:hypothetical protein
MLVKDFYISWCSKGSFGEQKCVVKLANYFKAGAMITAYAVFYYVIMKIFTNYVAS